MRTWRRPRTVTTSQLVRGLRGRGGMESYLVRPDQSTCCWRNGRGDDDTHEQIQVAHSYTDVVKHGGKTSHEQRKSGHTNVVDAHQLFAGCSRVDVGLVNIVGRDRRDRDELRRVSAHNRHVLQYLSVKETWSLSTFTLTANMIVATAPPFPSIATAALGKTSPAVTSASSMRSG